VANCEQPVSEQATGEALSCGWSRLQSAVGAVINHPSGANVTEWVITILLALVLLFFLVMIIRRR